jgi:hypothetical protein
VRADEPWGGDRGRPRGDVPERRVLQIEQVRVGAGLVQLEHVPAQREVAVELAGQWCWRHVQAELLDRNPGGSQRAAIASISSSHADSSVSATITVSAGRAAGGRTSRRIRPFASACERSVR